MHFQLISVTAFLLDHKHSVLHIVNWSILLLYLQ